MDYCNSALDPYRPQYIYFWRVFQMKLIMRSIQMNSLGGRCYLTQPRADWYCRFYEREFCLSVVFFFFFYMESAGQLLTQLFFSKVIR